MLIALDYDKTYTLDPVFWEDFIVNAKTRGHEVVIVTLRFPDVPIQPPPGDTGVSSVEVIYTSMKPKGVFMYELKRVPDVWIDDRPDRVFK